MGSKKVKTTWVIGGCLLMVVSVGLFIMQASALTFIAGIMLGLSMVLTANVLR